MKTLEEIVAALESAGVAVTVKGDKAYVGKTPCGEASGYCVAADHIVYITGKVTKRAGEIKQILLKALF